MTRINFKDLIIRKSRSATHMSTLLLFQCLFKLLKGDLQFSELKKWELFEGCKQLNVDKRSFEFEFKVFNTIPDVQNKNVQLKIGLIVMLNRSKYIWIRWYFVIKIYYYVRKWNFFFGIIIIGWTSYTFGVKGLHGPKG